MNEVYLHIYAENKMDNAEISEQPIKLKNLADIIQ